MEVFHVMGGGGYTTEALRLMDGQVNLLVSGWAWHHQPEIKRNKNLIREKSKLLLFDSGFLSAANKGEIAWADQQDLVLEGAEEIGADRVAMMDIPMAPKILIAAGFVRPDGAPDFGRALEITYRNAERMVSASTKVSKGFVNQGWTLEQRMECHRTMVSLGADTAAGWWGIGTVAMRTPDTGLYEHAEWCRENIPGHLHTLGIAHPEWAKTLRDIGIDSLDSATASYATAYGEWIVNGRRVLVGKRGGIEEGRLLLNNRMKALMYWYNVEAINHAILGDPKKRPYDPGPTQGRFAI